MFTVKRSLISPKSKYAKSIKSDVISILQTIPPQAQIHVKSLDRIYIGKFRLDLRDESRITPTDWLFLFNSNEPTLSFKISDIQDVRVVQPYMKYGKKPSFKEQRTEMRRISSVTSLQIVFSTFKVSTNAELMALAELTRDIDLAGIVFNGENVGRHGKVSWIILAAGKTLIPLDIISLQKQSPRLWAILGRRIFANEKMLKIIHDCRPAADYLLHVHQIRMVNVFDTQISDLIIARNSTGQVPERRKHLSECLDTYNHRVPDFEIDLLRNFEESFDFKANSGWLTPTPDPRLLKYGALQVKHLVPLHKNQMKKMLAKFTNCVQQSLDSVAIVPDFHYSETMEDQMEVSSELQKMILKDSEADEEKHNRNHRNNNINDAKSGKRTIVLIPSDSDSAEC